MKDTSQKHTFILQQQCENCSKRNFNSFNSFKVFSLISRIYERRFRCVLKLCELKQEQLIDAYFKAVTEKSCQKSFRYNERNYSGPDFLRETNRLKCSIRLL